MRSNSTNIPEIALHFGDRISDEELLHEFGREWDIYHGLSLANCWPADFVGLSSPLHWEEQTLQMVEDTFLELSYASNTEAPPPEQLTAETAHTAGKPTYSSARSSLQTKYQLVEPVERKLKRAQSPFFLLPCPPIKTTMSSLTGRSCHSLPAFYGVVSDMPDELLPSIMERVSRKGRGGRLPAADPTSLPGVDPKRAKRIIANRESAARSKMKQKVVMETLKTHQDVLVTQRTTHAEELNLLRHMCRELQAKNSQLEARIKVLESSKVQFIQPSYNKSEDPDSPSYYDALPSGAKYTQSYVDALPSGAKYTQRYVDALPSGTKYTKRYDDALPSGANYTQWYDDALTSGAKQAKLALDDKTLAGISTLAGMAVIRERGQQASNGQQKDPESAASSEAILRAVHEHREKMLQQQQHELRQAVQTTLSKPTARGAPRVGPPEQPYTCVARESDPLVNPVDRFTRSTTGSEDFIHQLQSFTLDKAAHKSALSEMVTFSDRPQYEGEKKAAGEASKRVPPPRFSLIGTDDNPSMLRSSSLKGETGPPKTIWEAAERGIVSYITRSIERVVQYDVNQRQPQTQRTALHWAAEMGQVDVVEALMDYKADVQALDGIGRGHRRTQSPHDTGTETRHRDRHRRGTPTTQELTRPTRERYRHLHPRDITEGPPRPHIYRDRHDTETTTDEGHRMTQKPHRTQRQTRHPTPEIRPRRGHLSTGSQPTPRRDRHLHRDRHRRGHDGHRSQSLHPRPDTGRSQSQTRPPRTETDTDPDTEPRPNRTTRANT
eukprot:gene1320-32673_t